MSEIPPELVLELCSILRRSDVVGEYSHAVKSLALVSKRVCAVTQPLLFESVTIEQEMQESLERLQGSSPWHSRLCALYGVFPASKKGTRQLFLPL